MRQTKPWEYLGQSVPAERTSSAKPPEEGFSKRLLVQWVSHRLSTVQWVQEMDLDWGLPKYLECFGAVSRFSVKFLP